MPEKAEDHRRRGDPARTLVRHRAPVLDEPAIAVRSRSRRRADRRVAGRPADCWPVRLRAQSPNKDRTIAVLTHLAQAGETLVTDVEVYQEILHRYVAIGRLEAIDAAFASLDALVDEVLGFGVPEVRAARTLTDSVHGLSARDALHAAVMTRAGIGRIFSFDRAFDRLEGLERLG